MSEGGEAAVLPPISPATSARRSSNGSARGDGTTPRCGSGPRRQESFWDGSSRSLPRLPSPSSQRELADGRQIERSEQLSGTGLKRSSSSQRLPSIPPSRRSIAESRPLSTYYTGEPTAKTVEQTSLHDGISAAFEDSWPLKAEDWSSFFGDPSAISESGTRSAGYVVVAKTAVNGESGNENGPSSVDRVSQRSVEGVERAHDSRRINAIDGIARVCGRGGEEALFRLTANVEMLRRFHLTVEARTPDAYAPLFGRTKTKCAEPNATAFGLAEKADAEPATLRSDALSRSLLLDAEVKGSPSFAGNVDGTSSAVLKTANGKVDHQHDADKKNGRDGGTKARAAFYVTIDDAPPERVESGVSEGEGGFPWSASWRTEEERARLRRQGRAGAKRAEGLNETAYLPVTQLCRGLEVGSGMMVSLRERKGIQRAEGSGNAAPPSTSFAREIVADRYEVTSGKGEVHPASWTDVVDSGNTAGPRENGVSLVAAPETVQDRGAERIATVDLSTEDEDAFEYELQVAGPRAGTRRITSSLLITKANRIVDDHPARRKERLERTEGVQRIAALSPALGLPPEEDKLGHIMSRHVAISEGKDGVTARAAAFGGANVEGICMDESPSSFRYQDPSEFVVRGTVQEIESLQDIDLWDEDYDDSYLLPLSVNEDELSNTVVDWRPKKGSVAKKLDNPFVP